MDRRSFMAMAALAVSTCFEAALQVLSRSVMTRMPQLPGFDLAIPNYLAFRLTATLSARSEGHL